MKKQTKHLIFIYLFGLSVFITGCSQLKIIEIDNGQTIEKPGIIFFLPQTEINVVISVEQHTKIDGQFSKEAQTLLPVRQKNNTSQWQIQKVQIFQVAQPDSSQCYLLQRGNKISQIRLNDKNILLGFNIPETQIKKPVPPQINNFSPFDYLPDYNDYFIKKNTLNTIDTVYSIIKRDSISYTKRSFVKKEVEKNKTDYANDIYRYLIKVRKHKFRIMAAMEDSTGNTANLKIRFHHLDSLEQALKILIAGKKIITPYTFNFRFLPDSTNLTDTLAFYSNIYGINNHSGKPLIINIEPLQLFTKTFSVIHKTTGVPYRLPQQAIVRLFLGKTLLIEKQIPIAQMGQTLKLPVSLFRNKNTIISYSPQTGNIMGISMQP